MLPLCVCDEPTKCRQTGRKTGGTREEHAHHFPLPSGASGLSPESNDDGGGGDCSADTGNSGVPDYRVLHGTTSQVESVARHIIITIQASCARKSSLFGLA